MSKWFESVFLPSIFEQAGGKNNHKWLTKKQTAICIDNMARNECKDEAGTHIYYTCNWSQCTVTMMYSKRNNCGEIVFNPIENTPEKQAERIVEKENAEKARAERMKIKRPEMAEKIAKEALEEIKNLTDDLNDDDYAKSENDVAIIKARIKELQKTHALYA